MRQIHHSFPVQQCDLTECKLNRIVDPDGTEHFIASYPIEWTVALEAQQPNNDGTVVNIKMYEVTGWEEVEIAPVIVGSRRKVTGRKVKK